MQPTVQKYCSNLSLESPCTARKKVEAACHPACLPAPTLPSPSPVLSFGGRLDCRGDKLLSRAHPAWRNSVAMNHPTNLKEMVGGWPMDRPHWFIQSVGRSTGWRFHARDESCQLHHAWRAREERLTNLDSDGRGRRCGPPFVFCFDHSS